MVGRTIAPRLGQATGAMRTAAQRGIPTSAKDYLVRMADRFRFSYCPIHEAHNQNHEHCTHNEGTDEDGDSMLAEPGNPAQHLKNGNLRYIGEERVLPEHTDNPRGSGPRAKDVEEGGRQDHTRDLQGY